MDWEALHDDFTAIATTEQRLAHGMRFMYATGVYEGFGEFGRWELLNVPTEKLKADFELLATKGGIGLGVRDGALPWIYWLHNLFHYLKTNGSDLTPVGGIGVGGHIYSVSEASAMYCAYLQRKALENTVLTSYDRNLWAIREATEKPSKTTSSVEPKAVVAQSPEILAIERTALRDSYFAGFAEKIVIQDICWAVKQRYREWKRWIAGTAKDGSKPDRAFRAILKSGKRPQEYRSEPRPKEWN